MELAVSPARLAFAECRRQTLGESGRASWEEKRPRETKTVEGKVSQVQQVHRRFILSEATAAQQQQLSGGDSGRRSVSLAQRAHTRRLTHATNTPTDINIYLYLYQSIGDIEGGWLAGWLDD